MLRKLLFSVLVFSLVLAFTGTAFSGTPKLDTRGVDNKQAYEIKTDRDLVKATADKPQNARTFIFSEEAVDMPYPSTYAPDHECEIADWTDYTGVYYGSWWFGSDAGYLLGSQFDVQEFHSAVVYGAAVRIYASSPVAPDMTFKVWDDAGGVPGAMLYTETVSGADIGALGGGNWLFSFASSVNIPGTKYYVTYEFSGAATDSIRIGLNQNADGTDNGRGIFGIDDGINPVTWMTLTDAFGGTPLNLRLATDVCYIYSDCYWAASGLQYYIQIPTQYGPISSGTWSGIGQEFEAINDTLKTVTVIFYNKADGSQVYTGTAESNGCDVKVWGDDGTGHIDLGSGPLFSYTIPPGTANMFPVTNEIRANGAFEYHDIPVTGDLVFRGKFHVTANMSTGDPLGGQVNILVLDYGSGGSTAFDGLDNWALSSDPGDPWADEFWGNLAQFYFQAELCRDEYQDCQHQVLYTGADWGTSFSLAYDADGDGDFDDPGGTDGNYDEVAQLVKARNENRVEHASFMVANNYWYSGLPIGDFEVVFRIYNVGGAQYDGIPGPGAVIWESDPIPVSDASAWDAYGQLWVDVVIPDVLTLGDFFVGYKATNLGGTVNSRLRAANDGDWGSGNVNGGGQIYYYPLADWVLVENFGYADSWGWWIDVDFCSIPQPEWACGATDWATNQHDFQRTGHGGVGLGDVQCNLTLEWAYMHPTGKYGQFTGPVISGDVLVGTFRGNTGTEYKTFDLITKVEGYTITTAGNATAMPTIYNGVMYVTGGTSAQIVQAYDFATGVLLWDIGTTDPEGIALGMGATENNPYGNFIIWNDGTDDILFFSVDIGKVYAVYAADGTPYWGAPYVPAGFGSVSNRTGTLGSGANDGVLYYGFSSVVGGNIVALDATDGSVIWDLASGAGLQGNTAWGGGVTIEQFQAGMAYDPIDDNLYAVSTCSGDHPIAGTLYQLNGSNGNLVNPAQPVNGVSNAVTPVIDALTVLVPTRAVWVAPINDPDCLQVYRKSDLTFSFGTGYGGNTAADYMVADMVMTCEVEADDYVFFFGRRGVFHAINGNTGDALFERQITDQAFGGAAGAIAEDSNGKVHLVFQDASGGMYDLTQAVDPRARLVVLRGNAAEDAARGTVPFGNDPNYPVEFTSVFSNNGCVDLTVEMTIAATSNGAPNQPYPYRSVSNELGESANGLAQELASNSSKLTNAANAIESPIYDENVVTYEKPVSMNPAALALDFIIDEVLYDTVAPGNDPIDVTVYVDQPAVGRGVFPYFLSFTDYNDPDYWLDDPTLGPNPDPEVMLTFLGGCIMEYTDLHFGFDQANLQTVFNSGRLVEDGIGGFTIDGDSKFFQGMYIFGVSPTRLAWTIVSWLEGSGETSTWNSWLPELIDGQCVPVLTEAVAMGNYSADGLDYSATIMGNVVEYNSIDSVQNFADPGEPDGWNHANFIAPFDNDSTMGLTIHHATIGAYDYGLDTANWGAGILDDIGNATIEIFDFTERNGNAVPDWHIAGYYDWDIGARDTTNVHQDASLAYTYAADDAASTVGGAVKLPFNFCGNPADPNYLEPMLRGLTLGQEQAMWGSLGSGGNDVYYLDSVWYYMTLPDDSTEYVQIDYSADDQAGSYIYARHDFAPNETFRMAIANFQFANYGASNKNATRLKALAHTLNKWMGFGRGDVNNDNVINMMDIIYTSNYVGGGPGPIPFEYLGDVNVDGVTNALDVSAIADYYFNEGGCFGGEWTL